MPTPKGRHLSVIERYVSERFSNNKYYSGGEKQGGANHGKDYRPKLFTFTFAVGRG